MVQYSISLTDIVHDKKEPPSEALLIYNSNFFFNRCTVEADTSVNFATCLIGKLFLFDN